MHKKQTDFNTMDIIFKGSFFLTLNMTIVNETRLTTHRGNIAIVMKKLTDNKTAF